MGRPEGSLLQSKAIGVLAGAAVGDALGGATEGFTPAQIQQRYGGFVTGIVPPFNPDWRTARPIAPYHKGDGHVTDDTLMTRALVDVYARRRSHLDAYAVAEDLVPLLMSERRWIPELEVETLLLHRIFLAEKWLALRLHYAHVDPREAGVGNVVNCGAAMYVSPVGVANAGDPAAAYAEAIDIAGAHQSSYGREAAGVFAAAVAAAMAPGATVDDVVAAAIEMAHDGTRAALEAIADGMTVTDWRDAMPVARKLITPFDTVGPEYRSPAMDARRPSRTKSIEELPAAIGLLIANDGDFRGAVLGGVNYGRDADSIASMAGAIAGGIGGSAVVPPEWRDRIARASRLDLDAPGLLMAGIAAELYAADERRAADRRAGMETLRAAAVRR